jgi:group I intron endonuclease
MITYTATNTENGKFYIGSTTNFERRQKEHLTTAQEFHFQRALRRNPDLFSWEVYEDDSEGPVLEQALLDMWYGKKQCYNMCGFAGRPPERKGKKLKPEAYEKLVTRLKSNHPMRGKQRTEETKNKISQKLLGTKVPDEVRKKMSVAMTGKKKSPEHCAAISKGRKEKVKPKESKVRGWLPEIITWIEAGLSLRSIGKILGVSHNTVSHLLNKTQTPVYQWP